jgi:hypothetical protein
MAVAEETVLQKVRRHRTFVERRRQIGKWPHQHHWILSWRVTLYHIDYKDSCTEIRTWTQ